MKTRKLSDIPHNTILHRVASAMLRNGLPYFYMEVDRTTKQETKVQVTNN